MTEHDPYAVYWMHQDEWDRWYEDFTEEELYYEALVNHMEYVDGEETQVCS